MITGIQIVKLLKATRPTGPWAIAAECPVTGAIQEAFWSKWNQRSMERWVKLYEALGYEIMLPVPGTTVWPSKRNTNHD
ncbi:MAG: hypothetical protein C0519_11160 [Hyphomicrobium sp.]|nr:hypothetical protein [Hyphomicrobium sp.]PPD06334.1 MAG: hypothetical protein CTY28_13790 [Hyphomicrobium sp.]